MATITKNRTEQVLNPSSNQSQKSFYGKAKVIREGSSIKLKSYSTIVATYNIVTDKMKVNGYYSPTTMRHLNAFFAFLGKDQHNKATLTKEYNL